VIDDQAFVMTVSATSADIRWLWPMPSRITLPRRISLLAVYSEVLFDLDPELGVREAHAVAGRRPNISA